MLLMQVSEARQKKPFSAPACRCNTCDQLMEFDELESSYFRFLSTVPVPAPAPDVAAAVAQASTMGDQLLRDRSYSDMPMSSGATGSAKGPTPSPAAGSSLDRTPPAVNASIGASGAKSADLTRLLPIVIVTLLTLAIGLLIYALFRGA